MHKSLWRIDERELKNIMSSLQNHRFIILRRERKLKASTINDKNELVDLGSLVILAFDLSEDQEAGRKAVERLLHRSPHLYLCRSVYAFPQPRGIYGKTPLRRISEIVNELGGKITILPRMAIVNTPVIDGLIQEAKARLEGQLSSMIKLFQQKNYKELRFDVYDLKELEKLKVKVFRFKTIVSLYAKWLNLDSTHFMKEIQKMLKNLERIRKERFVK